MTVYGYGQGRGGAFVATTQGMRELLHARPREQEGAMKPGRTAEQRREIENKLIKKRLRRVKENKYPPPLKPLELKK